MTTDAPPSAENENSKLNSYDYLETAGINEITALDLTTSKLKQIKKELLAKLFIKLQTYVRSRAPDLDSKLEESTCDLPTNNRAAADTPDGPMHSSQVVLELIRTLKEERDAYVALMQKFTDTRVEGESRIHILQADMRVRDIEMSTLNSNLNQAESDLARVNDELRSARDVKSPKETVNINNVVNELSLRGEKEKNLVIYGIDEADNREANPDETEVVCRLFSEVLGCSEKVPAKCFRMGKVREQGEKPRPFKIFMESVTDKQSILNNAYKLKNQPTESAFRRVFVRQDLTLMQRKAGWEKPQKSPDFPLFGFDDFPALSGAGSSWRGRGRGQRYFAFGRGRPWSAARGGTRFGNVPLPAGVVAATDQATGQAE